MASLFRSRIWTLLPIRKCRVTNRRAAAGRIPHIAGKRRNNAEARASRFFAFKARPKVWLRVLNVFVGALFAGNHGANEIFTMNEAG
jgi:hypothetical protein